MTTAVAETPQMEMEEERLELDGLNEALQEYTRAEAAYAELKDTAKTVNAARKAKKDAKDAVVAIIPLDGKPHTYRHRVWTMSVAPPDEREKSSTRVFKDKVTITGDP